MKIGLDSDEVLSAFQEAVLDIASQSFGRRYTVADLKDWDLFSIFNEEETEYLRHEVSRPGFCASLPVLEGAREAVETLRLLGDVYVVTSPFTSQTWVYERTWWLNKHFGFDRNHVIHTSAKHLVRVDAFLDDRPKNVIDWSREHPKSLAMLWPLPNTAGYPMTKYRVEDWPDVIRRVRDHKVSGLGVK